jgi:ubiquinone biosynthesis protein COQ4
MADTDKNVSHPGEKPMMTGATAHPSPFVPLPSFLGEGLRGLRALRALLRDPEDLPQVFTIIEAWSGGAKARLVRGFQRSEVGRRLLAERLDIVPLLRDRMGLAALPEGSLGRAYLELTEAAGISAEGILEASQQGEKGVAWQSDQAYVHERMRDTHDLWHAVTGYPTDVLGEAGLLAFSIGQNWNPGIALILLGGLIDGRFGRAMGYLAGSFELGRRAEWLPSQRWEDLLARPLDEVRRELRTGAATRPS